MSPTIFTLRFDALKALTASCRLILPVFLLAQGLSIGPTLADDAKSTTTDTTTVQTPASVDDIAASVDPEKKAAIKELLSLTNMTTNADAIQNMMLLMVRQSINAHLKTRIQNDENLSESQKSTMLAAASDASDRVINRYKELYQERINLHTLMEQVGYKVYDESFTLSELKDLVAFYRTPTGQKSMKEMPQILKRSMMLTTSIIQPKVADIIKEISTEEMARLKKDNATTPAAGSTTTSPTKAAPPTK